ncbi:hypothetical protein [Scandinavium manionii]|uniref:hypothetical protein n=1 Tax=Scandinavium manionii TaxID=2926520 RepID=UPI001359E134|nr:hypothetical protein [Scandinavium manionii]MCS2148018.1 hypothetical protein [Scandinavium manionii]
MFCLSIQQYMTEGLWNLIAGRILVMEQGAGAMMYWITWVILHYEDDTSQNS